MPKVESKGYFDNWRHARNKQASASSPGAASFDAMLTRAQNTHPAESSKDAAASQSKDSIEQLLESVHTQGEEVAREGTWSALVRYREVVQRFIARVVGGAVDVERHTSGHSVANRKEFSLITVINGRLNSMAESILSSQSTQLQLLHSVGEIYGLLVDIRS